MLTIAALIAAAVIPCSAPARTVACPDLVMRPPYDMRIVRSGRRSLLASASAIVNVGDGPLEIRARRPSGGQTLMAARQVLRPLSGRGRPRVLLVSGRVEYYDTGTRGTYWKYHGAAGFTLRPVGPGGTVGPVVRTGPKVEYCFRDLRRVHVPGSGLPYPGSLAEPSFGACSTTAGARSLTLGTSVGWADIYPADYPQNALDVTGLAGCFSYTLTADPDDQLRELREDDNSASVVVRLPWVGPGRHGCPRASPPR